MSSSRPAARAARPSRSGPRERHRNLLGHFGTDGVPRERARYGRDVTGQYRQELIERFLHRNLVGPSRRCLEVGPGPGRFSRWLAARYPSLHLFDLSRPMLRACRRHLQRTAPSCRGTYIEGSLEAIPFRPRSFDRIVALGVLPFVADEFPRVLRDLGHLLARRGRLVFELPTPSQTTMTVLPPNPTGARTILHRPKEYHLWEVVREGYQPHDPAHWARFEFVWRRPEPLQDELTRAGLRIVDRMAIGPNFANQPAFLKVLRHDRSAYRTALELEEEIGRWPEVLGAGAGLLVAATPVPRATDPTGRTGRAHGPRRARA